MIIIVVTVIQTQSAEKKSETLDSRKQENHFIQK